MINVVEGFSGIGAQTTALKMANINHQVTNTIEWEVGAIFAYDILHNGPQDLSLYRHHTKESLIKKISEYNISNDGKSRITPRGINFMSMLQIKSILYSIERNNNLVDIEKVNADSLPDEIDLFTYSFPCQDLSVSSRWWKNDKGIRRDSGGQSSLLWEVERILSEIKERSKDLPRFLLMENVNAILSPPHVGNFKEWISNLESYGYYNKIYTLNASKFGIPQNRVRTYMISVWTGNKDKINSSLDDYFLRNDLEEINLTKESDTKLEEYLRLNYSNEKYRVEAIKSTPKNTPSRQKIFNSSVKLAIDDQVVFGEIARTITTKQDRNPNSGIIVYDKEKLVVGRSYRNLTPRETFLLMGFNEESFDILMENNIEVATNKLMLPDSKLLKLAGNSIVVDVLKEIFLQMEYISNNIL